MSDKEKLEKDKKSEEKKQPKDEKPEKGFQKEKGDISSKFKTLKKFEKIYGTTNKKFIEVTLKEVTDDGTTFVSISKGYFDLRGNKRYKTGMGFPDRDELKKFIVDSMKEI